MGYVLGLDLGPSSIGWAAVERDLDGRYKGFAKISDNNRIFPALGVRTFPLSVEPKKWTTKNSHKRIARGMRTRLRRRKERRKQLFALFQSQGFLPTDKFEIEKINKDQNIPKSERSYYVYRLRNKALTEKIELEQIARLLLHMAKRRGFKSNRKEEANDEESGKIADGQHRLEIEKGDMTLGQFYYSKKLSKFDKYNYPNSSKAPLPKFPIRNRKGRADIVDEKDKPVKDYHWMAKRKDYEMEFVAIWKKQRSYYGKLLSAKLYKQIKQSAFDQYDYELSETKKRRVIGKCKLEKGQLRCSYSKRCAQKYRLLETLNNLRVLGRPEPKLTDSEWELAYKKLMTSREISLHGLRTDLKLAKHLNFTHESGDDDKKIKGNAIDSQMCKVFGEETWLLFDETTKEKAWGKILDHFTGKINGKRKDINLARRLVSHLCISLEKLYNVQVKDVETLQKIHIPEDYCAYSEKAINKLLYHMEKKVHPTNAKKMCGYDTVERKVFKELPEYTLQNGFDCNNPRVRQVLAETRKVVNAVIKELGRPERITIECIRELKAGAKRMEEIRKRIKENEKTNNDARDAIKKHSGSSYPSDTDILKYKFWIRQKFRSVYSDRCISLSQLLCSETEIDHILPESIIPDNSMENRVLCFWDENRDKGQETPISWLAEKDPKRWEIVQQNIAHWNPDNKNKDDRTTCESNGLKPIFGENENKWRRFFVKTEDILKEYTPNNLLRDTSYIATAARDYVGLLYDPNPREQEKHALFTRGVITGELRKYYDMGKKDRSDLRHHAEDAAIVACMNDREWERISQHLRRKGYWKRHKDAELSTPWPNFIEDLKKAKEQIVVSHKPNLRVRGKLHSDKPTPHNERSKKSIPLGTDAQGKDILVEPGETHHVEIFCLIEKNKRKYYSCPRTNFDILKTIAESQGLYRDRGQRISDCVHIKKHPKFPNAKYVMSIGKGDILKMKSKAGEITLAYVTSTSANAEKTTSIELEAQPIWTSKEVKLDKDKNQDEDTKKKNKDIRNTFRQNWRLQGLKEFENCILEKLYIDPLGRSRWAEKKDKWGDVLKSD